VDSHSTLLLLLSLILRETRMMRRSQSTRGRDKSTASSDAIGERNTTEETLVTQITRGDNVNK
jgi:hypothetical protein